MLSGCTSWPAEFSERYKDAGYWTSEVLGDLLAPTLSADGSQIALVSGTRVVTYAELHERVNAVAAGFQQIGIGRHDRMVVQLPNGIAFAETTLALFRLGAIPVFALPVHRRHEIVYLCNHTEAVAYVMPGRHQGFDFEGLADEVRAEAPALRHIITAGAANRYICLDDLRSGTAAELTPPDAGDVAFFLLSGGTTGEPKLIPRTHQDYAYQLRATADGLGVTRDTVYLAALPVSHNAALGCPGLLGTLRAGGKVILADSANPAEAFPLIAREGVTLTTLMPSLLKLWIEMTDYLPIDLSRVLFQVGGAWLDPEVARQVHTKLHAKLTHWFGMAEGFLSYTRLDDPVDAAVYSTGSPLCDADDVRLVDDADRDVPVGQIGELLVRGPYTLRGYYQAEEYNKTAFATGGYLRTGDLVRIDSRGHMVVEGRIKDIVNRGGEKVPAREVEEWLVAHPGVRQAAVVAMPDPSMGEKTCAFLVGGRAAPDSAALREYLRAAGLAEYKVPDHIEYVEALPYTALGKVDKRLLRARIGRLSM